MGALILSDPILEVLRRELRRVSPDVRIELEQIKDVLSTEVLKREVLDGDNALEARKKISRAANKLLRKVAKEASKESEAASPESPSTMVLPS